MPFDLTVCTTGLYSQDSGEKPPATFPRSGGRSNSSQLSWFVDRSVRKSWGYWCCSLVSHLEVHPQCTKELKIFLRKQAHQAQNGTSRSRCWSFYIYTEKSTCSSVRQGTNGYFRMIGEVLWHICNASLASAESPWAAGIKCLECWHQLVSNDCNGPSEFRQASGKKV